MMIQKSLRTRWFDIEKCRQRSRKPDVALRRTFFSPDYPCQVTWPSRQPRRFLFFPLFLPILQFADLYFEFFHFFFSPLLLCPIFLSFLSRVMYDTLRDKNSLDDYFGEACVLIYDLGKTKRRSNNIGVNFEYSKSSTFIKILYLCILLNTNSSSTFFFNTKQIDLVERIPSSSKKIPLINSVQQSSPTNDVQRP